MPPTEPDDAPHALLLRLFRSQYFSPHLALSYLKLYSDSIGITYYLVDQLQKAFDPSEVEFYWAELCHLLISRPSKSRALEYFVLQRCDESVHVALLTLWHFQASLYDLSANPNTDSFQVCQRVFNQCQRLLYDDPLADTDLIASSSGSSVALDSSFKRRLRIKARSKKGEKVLPSNVLPCFVGIGAVIASVPGMPRLAEYSGKVAIEQGRRKPQGRDRAPLEGSGMQRIAVGGEDESNNGSADEDDELSDDDGLEEDDRRTHETDAGLQSRTQDGKAVQKNAGSSNGNNSAPSFSSELAGVASTKTLPQRPIEDAPKKDATSIEDRSTGVPSSIIKPSIKPPARSNSKDLTNSLANLTTGFNEFRDKAAAAVNDVFGQRFGVDFAPGTPAKDPAPAPLWHRQSRHKRKDSSHLANLYVNRSAVDVAPRSSLAEGRNPRWNGASTSNLTGRNSMSVSPFGSSATLTDDPSLMTPEAVLARYDGEARRRLLRSNYCRKQTQFLQTLQDISARLLILPKPARLSALRAELTELNHGLPSEVCFPLWCEAAAQDGQETSDAMDKRSTSHKTRNRGRHHRVIRLDPSEAVVLNSADRAPYLLHVEVLRDDLDFDPDRRQNRESLKKLVMQEDLRRRKTQMSRSFSASGGPVSSKQDSLSSTAKNASEDSPSQPEALPGARLREVGQDVDFARRGSPPPIASQKAPFARESTATPVIDEEPSLVEHEEIDLTEQAYGSDLAAFGVDDGDGDGSDEEDLTAININHDTAAWSRGTGHRNSLTPATRAQQGKVEGQADPSTSVADKKREFSLDEYAERMRTAAIMLAQLNQSTNASSQPIVATNPHVSSTAQGGWSSWIIGTSWAATGNGARSEAGQASAGVKAPLVTNVGGSAMAAATQSAASGANGGTSAGKSSTAMLAAATSAAPRGTGARLMHTDTEMIRKRIMQEMMALEEERMERMKSAVGNRRARRGANVEDEATVQRAVNKDDPSAAMFRESWAAKKARIRSMSPYGHLENWDVFSVIVKTGADLRQEQLAVQLIQEFARIWGETGSRCWVRYFRILVTSENSGIMETITDSVSVHSIKKEAYSRRQQQAALASTGENGSQPPAKIATYSLLEHYIETFGDPSSAKYAKARQCFMESLAGYSIISYLLQLKDRHNGNILIDNEGHLIHIDFGFLLGISPGGVGFEAAPFKITQEYVDVIGGIDSPKFVEFKALLVQGFRDVRKEAERIIMIVELMERESKLPCFALGDLTSKYLRDRFQLALSQSQCDDFVDRLITGSINSTFTRLYDQYQYYSEGILS